MQSTIVGMCSSCSLAVLAIPGVHLLKVFLTHSHCPIHWNLLLPRTEQSTGSPKPDAQRPRAPKYLYQSVLHQRSPTRGSRAPILNMLLASLQDCITMAGGYLQNPRGTGECTFCSISFEGTFLESVNSSYSEDSCGCSLCLINLWSCVHLLACSCA